MRIAILEALLVGAGVFLTSAAVTAPAGEVRTGPPNFFDKTFDDAMKMIGDTRTTLPPHVCINDLVITCAQQANAIYFHRNNS
jgi:hypothetical protein